MGDQGSNGHRPVTAGEPEGLSRRGFLVGAAGLTGVALSGVWKGAPALAAEGDPFSAVASGESGGIRFLELDGKIVGSLKSVEGGTVVGTVEEEPAAAGVVKKHIANVKYEEFTVKAGFSMGKPMYDWLKLSFLGKHTRQDGAIHNCDFDGKIVSSLAFFQALITEIGFPACDASSKEEPDHLTIKFRPESTVRKPGGGQVTAKPSNQKTWLPANFRITIGDLPTAKVNKIDSFTVKQNFEAVPDGQGGSTLEPTTIEFPNLKVTVAESQPWYDWHEDFLIGGKNDDEQELTGKLEFLSLDLSKVLLRMGLEHLGIFGLKPILPEPNPAALRRLWAEMYCEQMDFEYRPAT